MNLKKIAFAGLLALVATLGAQNGRAQHVAPSDPTMHFKVGGFLEFRLPLKFQSATNLQRFQDGRQVSDEETDEERALCNFGLRQGVAPGAFFNQGHRVEITGSKRISAPFPAEVYYLQKDPQLSILLCWGEGDFPTLDQIKASFGENVAYIP